MTSLGNLRNLAEAADQLSRGDVSAVALTEECLERMDRVNPRVNAFITVLSDEVLSAAKNADHEMQGGRRPGALHGIPVAVKDFYDTAGVRTTAAAEQFKNRVPKNDADVVAALKRAGALLLGKTNMHVLGSGTTSAESFFGPVRNPHNNDYIAGGSSGGSAAAVATGMCYATVDTDAIGSCRLPASCCGVVGFKPTYGAISLNGILAGEEPPDETIVWLSHAAMTTRSVQDAAIVFQTLSGRQMPELARRDDIRVGVATNFEASSDIRKAFDAGVNVMRRSGLKITDTNAPLYDPRSGVAHIERDRKTIADEVFSNVDVMVLPTTAQAVPRLDSVRGNALALSPANTVFANYYGLPAISVPCGSDQNGLPAGLQIVGRPNDDATVLQVAHAFEMSLT